MFVPVTLLLLVPLTVTVPEVEMLGLGDEVREGVRVPERVGDTQEVGVEERDTEKDRVGV